MEQEYIYAVARIKARELSLLTQQDLDRLMACKTSAECFRALADKGWGAGGETSAEAIFAAEEEKTWALMHELLPDLTPFSVLLYPIDFNNMKAAVKCTVTNAEPHNVFMSGGTVEPEKMQQEVRENDFSLLPDFMAEAAKKATDALLTTRDGQRCDIILDRACLTAIHKTGKESKNALITAFSEFKVAAADIKIAARALHTGKSRAFLEESLAPCDTLDLEELIDAASKDTDTFYAYLSRTDYADGVKALKDGFSAFEKWCDDRQTALVKEISRQDYFTVAPLLGYVTARQNEISTVRIIISGKQNNLPDERIRARLRERGKRNVQSSSHRRPRQHLRLCRARSGGLSRDGFGDGLQNAAPLSGGRIRRDLHYGSACRRAGARAGPLPPAAAARHHPDSRRYGQHGHGH